jgi:hypothetical protein
MSGRDVTDRDAIIEALDDDAPDYELVKATAKVLGRDVKTLLGLSPGNDPFYAGLPARRAAAEWFADVWSRMNPGVRVHLRRVHYVISIRKPPWRMHDGSFYENTDDCWQKMLSASKDARYLGLIDRDTFDDKRTKEALVADRVEAEDALVDVGERDGDALPPLSDELPPFRSLVVYPPVVPQRYAVVIFVEKDTLSDIMQSLHEEFGVDIITGTGELSDIRCQEIVDRADGRPIRVLTVTDFDPGGDSMPVAIARKIEHRLRGDGLDLDLQVRHILLTKDQCEEYDLPPKPIKESEKRAASFQERRDFQGGVELDALEALHPGVIRNIRVEEIERYYDSGLSDRINDVTETVEHELEETNAVVLAEHADNIEQLRTDYTAMIARHNAERAPLAQRFESIERSIAVRLETEAPDADAYDWPEPDDGDEDPDPMFDSGRGYLEQIERYREHQGKPDAEAEILRAVCPHCSKEFFVRRGNQTTCGDQKCKNKATYQARQAIRLSQTKGSRRAGIGRPTSPRRARTGRK